MIAAPPGCCEFCKVEDNVRAVLRTVEHQINVMRHGVLEIRFMANGQIEVNHVRRERVGKVDDRSSVSVT